MKQPTKPIRKGVLLKDAFFSPKLDKFYQVTLPDSFAKFEAEHILENWVNAAKGEGKHYKQTFNDGLIYEMIRGASDYPAAKGDKALYERIDRYTELFAAAQDYEKDGFIGTCTTLQYKGMRFGHNGGTAIWQHDTYNLGCLLEAGIHYYMNSGKTNLLALGIKAMNYLCDVCGPGKWNLAPDHSMLEGSLSELCDLMDDEPDLQERLSVPLRPRQDYLDLCSYYVHCRGRHHDRLCTPRYMGEYCQDHVPVEMQHEAVGHAVRAVLFYRGIAMLARLQNDETLWGVARDLWDNITQRKMYINGGVGTSAAEEKFSYEYELPNNGYMETCATAALILFAQEMQRVDIDAQYADIIEKAMYNLMLEAVSDSGDMYTYVNPMMSKGEIHRWQWNECPCCPPMIHKTFSMTDEMLFSQDDDSLYVHMYVGSELNCDACALEMKGSYPWNGRIEIRLNRVASAMKALKLRIPGWCEKYEVLLNGQPAEGSMQKGYLVLSGVAAGDEITLTLDMPVRRVEAHPYVRHDKQRVAIQRGPVVYCLEGVDNKGNTERVVPENWQPGIRWMPDVCGGVMGVTFDDAEGRPVVAVPYFSWDNRRCGSMDVWLRQEGMAEDYDNTGWENILYRFYK